jgi:hypothetical protein
LRDNRRDRKPVPTLKDLLLFTQGIVLDKPNVRFRIPHMKKESSKDVSKAASLMGRKSAEKRATDWGEDEFKRKMREWGKMGGRPKGSGKKKAGGTK